MIVNGIEFAEEQSIVCRIGDKRLNGFTVVIYSRNSADASIVCEGVTYPSITMTAYGTDQGGSDTAALYVGSQLVIVTNNFAAHDIVVTQSGNTVTYNQYTKPRADNRYRFAVATCEDGYFTEGGDAEDNPIRPTIYPFLESLIDEEGMPFTDLFWNDDIMYVDNAQVVDSGIVGAASTGIPRITLKDYDYGIGYAANLGLLPGNLTDTQDGFPPPNNNAYAANYGRIRSRVGFYKRVGLMPQWGNHEFGGTEGNTPGVDVPLQTNGAFHKTALGFDGPGYTSYQTIFGQLQPHETDIRNLDTACNLWGFEYGAFYVLNSDTVTNNKGVIDSTVFGNNQIDDMKAALTTSDAPHKLFISQYQPRNLTILSNQSKWEDANSLEYKRFMNNADGIMASGRCNGALGTFLYVSGDTHRGEVMYSHNTTGVVDENFYFFTAGMPNKGSAHGSFYSQAGNTEKEMDVIYSQEGSGYDASPTGTKNDTKETNEQALIFDVYGDLGRVRVRRFASYWDGRPTVAVFDEWFEWKKGNRPIDIEKVGYILANLDNDES